MDPATIHITNQLVKRCKEGDSSAQAELYKRYAKAMYNICTRMLVKKEDAEDALQEAFLDAFRNIRQFRGMSSFGSWLKRITIRKCINIANRHSFHFDEHVERIENHQPDNTDHELSISPEMIHQAVKKLPDGCRIIFTLHFLEGYDHGEIAGILKISESTSKSQLHRAKHLLRNLLTSPNHVG